MSEIPSYAREALFCMGSMLLVGVILVALGVSTAVGRIRRERQRVYGEVGHARPAVLPESQIGDDPLWERRDRGMSTRRTRRMVRFAWAMLPLTILLGLWLAYVIANADQAPTRADAFGNGLLALAISAGFIGVAGYSTWRKGGSRPAPESGFVSEQMRLHARPVHEDEALLGAVSDVATALGAETPPVYLIDSSSFNGVLFSAGSIGITRGLREGLTPAELRPVVAWLLVRRSESDVIEAEDYALRPEESEWTDAEAMRVSGDAGAMAAAWSKIMNAENRLDGSEWLPERSFLVPPGQRAELRGRRIAVVRQLAGAADA